MERSPQTVQNPIFPHLARRLASGDLKKRCQNTTFEQSFAKGSLLLSRRAAWIFASPKKLYQSNDMKKLLILLTIISAGGMVAEAGLRSCRVSASSNCCSTSWYKAKDGTFREMMPYAKALSRAEDADDMEIQLKGVQAELATATSTIETVQADSAKLKSELESQIAALTQQLESERQNVVAQTERGDKAEAAHKQCIEQIAALRDAGKKTEDSLKAVQSDLKKTSEERDSLKTARAELEQKLTDMTAAKTAAEEAVKVSQQELEKLKQEAAKAKKATVESEDKAKGTPEPDAGKPAADGDASPGEEVPKN